MLKIVLIFLSSIISFSVFSEESVPVSVNLNQEKLVLIKKTLRTIPDFPKKGINFYDITTLLTNPEAFRTAIDLMAEHYQGKKIDGIIAVESRGFIFGAALAERLNVPLILTRKPGKLPADKYSYTYKKEYGEDTLEIHKDSLSPGQRVVIVDDLIATGGTIEAALELAKMAKAEVVEAIALIELVALKGRDRIQVPVYALLKE